MLTGSRRPFAGPDSPDRPAVESDLPGLGEAVAVWAMFGLDAMAIALGDGWRGDLEGGAARRGGRQRRLGPFVGHPMAPAAVPLGLLAAARLADGPTTERVAGRAMALAVGAGLAAGGWALLGDPERVVGAAAAGVVAASLGLTVGAVAGRGLGGVAPATPGDVARLGLGGGLALVALPWLLADLCRYADDLPFLRRIYVARRLPTGGGGTAVHLGHHHGLDGALLVWTGLALSRQVGAVRPGRLRDGLAMSIGFCGVYGFARAVEDAWYEQVVKRGRTDVRLARLVVDGRPVSGWGWAAVVAAGLGVGATIRGRDGTLRRHRPGWPGTRWDGG